MKKSRNDGEFVRHVLEEEIDEMWKTENQSIHLSNATQDSVFQLWWSDRKKNDVYSLTRTKRRKENKQRKEKLKHLKMNK